MNALNIPWREVASIPSSPSRPTRHDSGALRSNSDNGGNLEAWANHPVKLKMVRPVTTTEAATNIPARTLNI